MKRTSLIFTAAVILTIATIANAQPHDRMAPPRHPGGDRVGMPLDAPAMADYLQLTAEQKTSWESARKIAQPALRALMDKSRQLHEQLDDAIESNADSCAVGTAFQAMRNNDTDVRAAHEALRTKLEAILSADQKARLEALHAVDRQRGGPPPPPPAR